MVSSAGSWTVERSNEVMGREVACFTGTTGRGARHDGEREALCARATSSPTSLLSLGSSEEDWAMRLRLFTRPGGTGGSRALAERSFGWALSFPSGGGVRGKDFEV